MHYTIGNFGHMMVIVSFVLSILAALCYYIATNARNEESRLFWMQNGRFAFLLQFGAVLAVIISLFLIIKNNYFEYHYAYTHSSKHLPVHYMISCFWEGQEGSFLLWVFWNCLLGSVLIVTQKKWEGPAMTVFALVQAFLTSMILGVVIFNIKIGSSPFLLLRDVLDAPIFSINPDFVPEDGTGLNPLLQNYWMVIHPPTLFLGYASTLVPFAFLIAGLWTKEFKSWIRPAIPWTIFSTALMALGQLMGAYWAYETLSFGGYWSWDPVENAVYIPWIIQVASIHTMLIYQKNSTALKTSMILVMSTFILVLYATFLTRSGILGNASVHSFTDLGLSGQLLIYLLTFLFISVFLLIHRWNEIPSNDQEVNRYNKEFWLFIGTIVLCLMAFQVIFPTSFPVFNAIAEGLGGMLNLAIPAEQALFYSKWQIWGAMLIALLSGIGQFFWWKNLKPGSTFKAFVVPIYATLILTAIIIIGYKMSNISYILLLTCSIYSLTTNGSILFFLIKKKPSLSGGAISHIGIALMLLGILFSAGYSKVVSLNRTGLVYSNDLSDEMNRENVLLFVDEPREMNNYQLIFNGKRKEAKGFSDFINAASIRSISDPYKAIAKEDLYEKSKLIAKKGDTLDLIQQENTYYEIQYKKGEDKAFSLYPRAQANPDMGLLVSPAIRKTWDKDLYTHISTIPDPDADLEWSPNDTSEVKLGGRFFANDYIANLNKVERIDEVDGVHFHGEDIAVEAEIEVFGNTRNYILKPKLLIKGRMMANLPAVNEELGLRVAFTNIYPDQDKFEMVTQTTQKDYIIMKAIEMPLINLLWIGSIVLMIGFIIATVQRFKDYKRGMVLE